MLESHNVAVIEPFYAEFTDSVQTHVRMLNNWLVRHAASLGFVPLWHGLRMVTADASSLGFGHRARYLPRAASSEQLAIGLQLLCPALMLTASLHSVHENDWQMLSEHLDLLVAGDLLLMERDYRRQSYAMTTGVGVPTQVIQLRTAARTWKSTTWRSASVRAGWR